MSIGDRLKALREDRDLKQEDIAKLLNVDRSTVGKWESSPSKPDYEKIVKLANYYGTTTDFILGNIDTSSKNKGVRVPVLGRIAAGIPIEAIDEVIDYEEIDDAMAKKGDYIGLKIKGDSMAPRIQDGDVVIIRKQPSVESGDIAAVLINGCDATLKKVNKDENGIFLIAYNHELFPPKFYSNKQIEELPVTIIGKVVELRGKL